jgi:sulfur carrier protein ThiS
MVRVFIDRENVWKEFAFTGDVNGLCEKLAINHEEVIIARNGELLLPDDMVTNDDEIKILYVLSGG